MARASKSSHIQIRVTRRQKSELVRRARAAGLGLSSFMLEKLAPDAGARFAAVVRLLSRRPMNSFALAELHDLLESLASGDFSEAVEFLPAVALDELTANQVSAMIETRAARLGNPPPGWVDSIRPLGRPWFPTELLSVRMHLLTNSPAAFRRRNLFVDSSLGQRV